MRCPSGIIFSRLLFVALNMWLVVSWGLQLEKEARDRKGRRLESVREEVAWWEGEVERLEGVSGGVRVCWIFSLSWVLFSVEGDLVV